MNTPDPLDAMLHESAPADVTISPGLRRDLRTMNTAASREAGMASPRRAPRAIVGLGLAFALIGTAGSAAAAAGAFSWLPWAEDPDVAYAFILPSGRACEGRIVLKQEAAAGNWDRFVESARTLQVDPADIEQVASEIRDADSLVAVNDDGTIKDGAIGVDPKTEDGTYAGANLVAVRMAATRLSAEAGVDLSWGAEEQFQCEAVAP